MCYILIQISPKIAPNGPLVNIGSGNGLALGRQAAITPSIIY